MTGKSLKVQYPLQKIACKEAIERFYKSKGKKSFRDYLNLKTFGIDKFSRMKLDKLTGLVDNNNNNIDKAQQELGDEKLVLNVLRWNCRGLRIDDAIRKVKTDLEVAKNMR